MNKRLYKSNRDRILFGVCGGVAEYFDVDAMIIRLLMLVFALTGAGVLFYIFAAIIMREENAPRTSYRQAYTPGGVSYSADGAETHSGEFSEDAAAGSGEEPSYAADPKHPQTSAGKGSGIVIAGLILIIIGVFYLINRFIPIFYWVDIKAIFAVLLVLIGIYFVAKR